MNAIDDIEQVVERTIGLITAIANRVTRFATMLALGAAVIVVGSFLLGVAATSGGLRTVWIVLGIVFAAIAVGAAALARWRVGAVRKDVPALAGEVRSLLSEGRQNTVQIIREFQDDDRESAATSAIELSRSVINLRGVVSHGFSGSAKLANTVSAITSFPGLALATIAITSVFAVLAVIFLLALALG